jgi:hypothetical protein
VKVLGTVRPCACRRSGLVRTKLGQSGLGGRFRLSGRSRLSGANPAARFLSGAALDRLLWPGSISAAPGPISMKRAPPGHPSSRIPLHGLRQQQHSEYFGRRELSILEHDPEKWMPVFGKDHAQTLKHDPEKWMPVFGKDHAQTKCRFNLIAFRFRAAAVPATAARCASHCPADWPAPPKFRSAGPGFSSTP